MKRTITFFAVLMAAVLLTLSGCSDFSFNPIGRWKADVLKIYEDGKLIETRDTKELGIQDQLELVFKKSGTGYIDSGTKNNLDFTYDYTDSEVTLNRHAKDAEPVVTVYKVTDNGNTLSVTLAEYEDLNKNGIKSTYREEMIFKR